MIYIPNYNFWVPSIISLIVAWHALLYKRSPRAAVGWMAIIILFPYAGAFLYFMLGINRIQTRAKKLLHQHNNSTAREVNSLSLLKPKSVSLKYSPLIRLSDNLSGHSLVTDNSVKVLRNGDEAYPAMLASINAAKKSIYLSTYIFDIHGIGVAFITALKNAIGRSVKVKVIIDGIGELGNFPIASRLLRKSGIPVARFIPPRLIPPSVSMNLRNHRKSLIVDNNVAFVGGMNISERHLSVNSKTKLEVSDIQFQLQGSITEQITKIFLEDWLFTTGQEVPSDNYTGGPCGNAICRAISDGPNEDIDSLLQIITGAISVAKKSVFIMTPYFIPPRTLIDALNIAALRGVVVDIILPERSDLRFVDWASRNMIWQLLQRGVNIYYQPSPFAHTKFFVVDGYYSQIGSANFDPRSLRLNFELAVEIYDRPLAENLSAHFETVRSVSSKVTLEAMDSRPLHKRTRDALAWLFSPYL